MAKLTCEQATLCRQHCSSGCQLQSKHDQLYSQCQYSRGWHMHVHMHKYAHTLHTHTRADMRAYTNACIHALQYNPSHHARHMTSHCIVRRYFTNQAWISCSTRHADRPRPIPMSTRPTNDQGMMSVFSPNALQEGSRYIERTLGASMRSPDASLRAQAFASVRKRSQTSASVRASRRMQELPYC